MKPALLLIDLQNDFLAARELQPTCDSLIGRAAALLDACRRRRIPVIHIWTTLRRDQDRRLPHWRRTDRWMCVAGTRGHQTPESLHPLAREIVIHKTGFNAFADGRLATSLRKLKCDSVIIAGLHLHACVRTAATECLERSFEVRVAEDAIASNDPIHAAATRRWLADRCVVFEPVNGIVAWLAGRTPALVHRSPRSTDQVLFEVTIAGQDEIAAATATARNAWTDWQTTSRSDRQRLLEKVASRLEASTASLARQMAIEIGKPVAHGREEVRRAAENIRDSIRRAFRTQPQRAVAGVVRYQPLGVVALISPWNNPVAIPMGKIAPALAYGNTVVWKPAPAATRIAEFLSRLLHDAGCPPGVVQLLSGDHTTAQRLASDANVNAITFTGSLAGGHAIQEICARRIVPLQAELSGNNAAIVWDDADFGHAARQIAWGAFAFAGQRCTANRRVIVPAAQFESFLKKLADAAEKLVWGDPLKKNTDIGPVIHSAKRDEIAALIARAQADPSVHRVLLLHSKSAKSAWTKTGAYAQPTIIGCDEPDHALVQEESMAPLLVVQRADDFDHALALCNGVRHGLAAALFSRSARHQKQFLATAQAGILKLNTSTAGANATLPFGGWKASGIGPPEHGEGDVLFYTRMQAVYGI